MLFLKILIISQVAAKEKLPSRLLLLPALGLITGYFCETVVLEVF